MAHSPLISPKNNPGPSQVCWWDIHSLSTLTCPGGRKNFAPACFSSARIRCAFNINPVYRSSGSGKQHGLLSISVGLGQTSSEFRFGGNSHCDLQQADRQAGSLSFRPC
ncbi:hypothetical protein AMECASPLE_038800 [Ameca splendens]|uniref:Uncharacterized protein n=1 Tax=Ameca splendens TaxID=208324 RepID=A0ABV0XXI2_9TELE